MPRLTEEERAERKARRRARRQRTWASIKEAVAKLVQAAEDQKACWTGICGC